MSNHWPQRGEHTWAYASAVMVVAVCALLAVLCVRISANAHASIMRDQQVRVACIDHGGMLIGGDNCVARRDR